MRHLFLIFVLNASAIAISVQTPAPNLKEARTKLEKALYKQTPYVKTARFTGCRLSISVDISSNSGFNSITGGAPSVMPTEGELAIPNVSGGGSGSRNLVLYDVDVSKVDPRTIGFALLKRQEHTRMTLNGTEQNVMSRTWNGKREKFQTLDLTVYSKQAESLAASFREAIGACKQSN